VLLPGRIREDENRIEPSPRIGIQFSISAIQRASSE